MSDWPVRRFLELRIPAVSHSLAPGDIVYMDGDFVVESIEPAERDGWDLIKCRHPSNVAPPT